MSKFEVGKWYYFKDEVSEAEFRHRVINNNGIADAIVEAEGFCPRTITAGNVTNVDLAYGDNKDMILYPTERKFFTEMVEVNCDEEWAEDGVPDDEETEAPEITAFPLTKITISNNEEAWSVFQMLKAHFKE